MNDMYANINKLFVFLFIENSLYSKKLRITLYVAFPDLEVYYNGERSMTEFKIKCYKHSGAKWNYIGLYTPDHGNKLDTCII